MGLFDKIKKAGTDFLQDGELIKKAMKQESFTNEELSLFSEKHNGQTPEEYRVEQEQLKAERAEKKRVEAENKRIDEIVNPKKYFRSTKSSSNIQVDEKHGLWKITNGLGVGSIYLYEELLSYDLSTNTGVQVKGGVAVGRAIVGGALLGPAGMVLGGVTGKKKHVTKINRIEINININGTLRNTRTITIYKGKDIDETSSMAKSSLKKAQSDLSLLDLISQSTPPTRTVEQSDVKTIEPSYEQINSEQTSSLADEIRKLKELADEGIITHEEFEVKKKELLDKI